MSICALKLIYLTKIEQRQVVKINSSELKKKAFKKKTELVKLAKIITVQEISLVLSIC